MDRFLRTVLIVLVLTTSLAPGWGSRAGWGASKTSTSREEQSLYNPILTAASGCTTAVLASALSTIGTTPTTLLLSPIDGSGAACTWAITSNQIVPRTVTLRVPRGAAATVSTGVTLLVGGPLHADDPDWYSGAGTVSFAYTSLGSEERFSTYLSGYVLSGCLPAPSASTTAAAFACTSVSKDGRQSTQDAAAVTFSGGDGTYWLAAHKDTTTSISSWTRQSGTHYLWRIASSQPTTPAGSVLVARLTVSGSAITAVSPLAGRNGPLPLSVVHGAYNAREFGMLGDTSDVTAALTQALATLPTAGIGGGKIIFPIGDYTISSPIDLKNLRNVTLECATVARRAADDQSCTMRYTASSGSLFTFNGATGITIRGFNLQYTHASYADVFIDLGQGTGSQNTTEILFEYNRIGGKSTSSQAATSLVLAAEQVYDITFRHNVFLHGVTAIRGSTTSVINSNIVTIANNLFLPTFTSAPIRAGGTTWNIEGNTFEPRSGSLGNALFLETIGVVGLNVVRNWMGDGNSASTVWVQLSHGPTQGVVISGNVIADINAASTCIDFGTAVAIGVTITGNDLHCGIAIYNLTNVIQPHIVGNSFSYGAGTTISIPPVYPAGLIDDINSQGGPGSTTKAVRLIATNYGQADPIVGLRNARGGNDVEWGLTNSAGYGSVLGKTSTTGHPFICLNCEHGTNDNTYRTRGKKGLVLYSDLNGRLVFGTVDNSSADNQAFTEQVRLGLGGHVEYTGTAPALTSCGTSPSIAGTDTTGKITIGTGGGITGCTATFATAFANTPACIVQGVGTNLTDILTQSVSTTQFQLVRAASAVITDGTVVAYHCLGRY